MTMSSEFLVPGGLALLGAAAWFFRRRITPEPRAERYELANKMLDVRSKLAAAGYDAGQVDTFVAALDSDPTGKKLASAFIAITPEASPDEADAAAEPYVFQTTAALGARIAARLNVLDAEIERVLLDIEILAAHHFQLSGADLIRYDRDHVRKMHRSWKVFRRRAARSTSEDYAGGSIASAVYLFEEVRLAEAFLKDITERLNELLSH